MNFSLATWGQKLKQREHRATAVPPLPPPPARRAPDSHSSASPLRPQRSHAQALSATESAAAVAAAAAAFAAAVPSARLIICLVPFGISILRSRSLSSFLLQLDPVLPFPICIHSSTIQFQSSSTTEDCRPKARATTEPESQKEKKKQRPNGPQKTNE